MNCVDLSWTCGCGCSQNGNSSVKFWLLKVYICPPPYLLFSPILALCDCFLLSENTSIFCRISPVWRAFRWPSYKTILNISFSSIHSGDGRNGGLFYKVTTTIAKVSVYFHVHWMLELLTTPSYARIICYIFDYYNTDARNWNWWRRNGDPEQDSILILTT